jgi:glycosyltransferase involved in cell wall biosynthesis
MAEASNPVHVCILTTAHPIDDVRVNHKFAHAFRGAGFRVSWIGPGHAFFDSTGYNTVGIEFRLCRPNRGRLDRLKTGRLVQRLAAGLPPVDVYYAPEPDAAQVAVRLARRQSAKVIFDVHEVFHGALLDRLLMGWRLAPLREYVRRHIARTCAACSLVVGVSDHVLRPYVTGAVRSMVVRSCAPSWFARGAPSDVCGIGRSTFTLMHGKCAGNRGTSRVLDAVELAGRSIPALRVVMFTNGAPQDDPEARAMLSRARSRGIDAALDLRAGVPMQQMPDVLRTCDAGLIAYGRDLGVDSLPNRLFEYMAAGLPVIAPVYAAEIARIVEGEQCGLLADFEDPASIGDAILRLKDNPEMSRAMGRRSREAFLARHNWEVEVAPLLDTMRRWFPDRGPA